MDTYGLDLGNGEVKAMSSRSNECVIFPSVIGSFSSYNSLDIGSKEKMSNLSMVVEGHEYAVGDMAIRNSNISNHDVSDDKYLSEDTNLFMHASLSLLSNLAFSFGNVVVGLPLHMLGVANKVATLYKDKKFGAKIGFFGDYEERINVVSIRNVLVVAQPHGTLFNLILDEEGNIRDRELASKGIAIFDIGYKTNDGTVFSQLEQVGRLTIQNKGGIMVAYEDIKNKINRSFSGLDVKTIEIPDIIKKGNIRGRDVSEIIDDSFYEFAKVLINEIKTRWEGAWEIEEFVFTGGGSALLKPYLEKAFPKAIFPSNCQTSNVEGYVKYGKRIWGDKK